MRSIANRVLALAIALLAHAVLSSAAAAQSNLGELLDASARRLSAEEFKEQIVQRAIVGPTATGGRLEVTYMLNGLISGDGTNPMAPQSPAMTAQVSGEWKLDDAERVCTAMNITNPSGNATILPPRCQYWFKLGDAYFLADSETDRRAKVLRRTLKP